MLFYSVFYFCDLDSWSSHFFVSHVSVSFHFCSHGKSVTVPGVTFWMIAVGQEVVKPVPTDRSIWVRRDWIETLLQIEKRFSLTGFSVLQTPLNTSRKSITDDALLRGERAKCTDTYTFITNRIYNSNAIIALKLDYQNLKVNLFCCFGCRQWKWNRVFIWLAVSSVSQHKLRTWLAPGAPSYINSWNEDGMTEFA